MSLTDKLTKNDVFHNDNYVYNISLKWEQLEEEEEYKMKMWEA